MYNKRLGAIYCFNVLAISAITAYVLLGITSSVSASVYILKSEGDNLVLNKMLAEIILVLTTIMLVFMSICILILLIMTLISTKKIYNMNKFIVESNLDVYKKIPTDDPKVQAV